MLIDVVGLTARGWDELSEAGRELVRSAGVVLGGGRHLALVPPVSDQQRLPWPSPLKEGLPDLLASLPAEGIVVLASGDPLVSGIGSTLIELLGAESVRIHPAVSSVALARARMGWAREGCEVVSLVGRSVSGLRPAVTPGARVLVLSSTSETPAELAAQLVSDGFGASILTVLGDLGTDYESRTSGTAASWSGPSPALNVVAVECRNDHDAFVVGRGPGLPNEAYDNDGQLTKRDVRASALAHLMPLPGQLLWDVGAGAGSVGIEWCRADPRNWAYAIERSPERCDRIRVNAGLLGVPKLEVITADVPDGLADLPTPAAIFVGGGASQEALELCWGVLPVGGRIVAHAVTLESEQLLMTAYQRWGGLLTRISVEVMEPLGTLHGWRPARAVVQWSAVRSV